MTTIQPKIKIGLKSKTHTHIQLPHGNSWIEVYSSQQLPNQLQMTPDTFTRIWNLHPTEVAKGHMFGKEIPFPRYTQSFGYDYHFNGSSSILPTPIEDSYLKQIIDWVRSDSHLNYQGLLVNWYEDGQHYIGPHNDNEKQIIKEAPIYSFSFGATRDFVVTSKNNLPNPYKIMIPMLNNTLIKMCGQMQTYYKHSVPKKSITSCSEPRINLTLRYFK